MRPSVDVQPRRRGAFVLGVILNTVIALYGTTMIGIAFQFRHSVAGLLWKEVVFSILVAAGLGCLMQYIPKHDNSATFVWICPAIWFALGLLLKGHLFAHAELPEFQKTIILFYMFTIPFVRGLAFSVGAFAAGAVFSKHDRTAGLQG